jgi:hypothetical protein
LGGSPQSKWQGEYDVKAYSLSSEATDYQDYSSEINREVVGVSSK